MIIPMENISQILMVLHLATAAIIIMKRDIRSLIKTYAFQSLLIAVLAIVFYIETGIITLLLLAVLFIVSKVVIIPYFMGKVQQKLNIKRDVKFHFLSPITALIVSIFIILFVYLAFTPLIAELNRFNSVPIHTRRNRRRLSGLHGHDSSIYPQTNTHRRRRLPNHGERCRPLQPLPNRTALAH